MPYTQPRLHHAWLVKETRLNLLEQLLGYLSVLLTQWQIES
jgi:hypothetical protein